MHQVTSKVRKTFFPSGSAQSSRRRNCVNHSRTYASIRMYVSTFGAQIVIDKDGAINFKLFLDAHAYEMRIFQDLVIKRGCYVGFLDK